MLLPTVVSDAGCSLSHIQGIDKSHSETGMGGTFLSWLTRNKREELQDNTAKTKATHNPDMKDHCSLKNKHLLVLLRINIIYIKNDCYCCFADIISG